MMSSRFLRCLPFLLVSLGPLAGQAQEVGPLTADPARALLPVAPPTAQRGQSLSLPFFDDFTSPIEGNPKATNWEASGGVLVNNRLAFDQPTRGVATFDGLRRNGLPYGSGGSGTLDTLTSQPIDLSGRTAADQLYLGFFWQLGNVNPGQIPYSNSGTRTVNLQLEFKDNAGVWRRVWIAPSNGVRSPFRRKIINITDAQYLHSSFQFRFRANGNVAANTDNWSLDYVRLAPLQPPPPRVVIDTLYQDVAISTPLRSLLARGTAMPVWQYNAAASPSSQLNSDTSTTVNNLDRSGIPTPLLATGAWQQRPAGPLAAFPVSAPVTILSNQRQVAIIGNLAAAAIPVTAEQKTIRHRIALTTSEVDPLTLPNDTISRDTQLADYYAFDDGTPEGSISVTPTQIPGIHYYALRFDLNRPDQVCSLRIMPIYPQAAGRQITINIWDADPANNGQPTALPRVSQSVTIPASLPAGQTFLEISFTTPVAVSGQFYAGYGNGPTTTTTFIPFGYDLNSPVPPDTFWQFIGSWSRYPYSFGTLMLRPVMNNNVLAVAPASVAAAYALYPNPSADGQVQVQGRYAKAVVRDALGRVAWQQPAAQAGSTTLDLKELPAGMYLVQLTLADHLTVTKRLVLTK